MSQNAERISETMIPPPISVDQQPGGEAAGNRSLQRRQLGLTADTLPSIASHPAVDDRMLSQLVIPLPLVIRDVNSSRCT